jgi:putative transposase
VAGRKTYLFAFIDDYSRAVVGHRFGYSEDTVRLAAALRPALASRGVPESIYVDYANLMVMPTSPGTRCSAGVHEPMLSA